jgi:hypothetical protein
MQEAEELQRLVWPGSETDIVPLHVLVTVAHNGGVVMGAYSGDNQPSDYLEDQGARKPGVSGRVCLRISWTVLHTRWAPSQALLPAACSSSRVPKQGPGFPAKKSPMADGQAPGFRSDHLDL